MKIFTILLLALISACNPFLRSVDYSVIQKAEDLGSKNQGLEKIIYQNEFLYLMIFSNGSKKGTLNSSESNYDLVDIQSSEIKGCNTLCQSNDKPSKLEIQRQCSSSISVNMNSLCLTYINQVKCVCHNKVYKTFSREVVLSQEEVKAKTKILESVIWIAPQ